MATDRARRRPGGISRRRPATSKRIPLAIVRLFALYICVRRRRRRLALLLRIDARDDNEATITVRWSDKLDDDTGATGVCRYGVSFYGFALVEDWNEMSERESFSNLFNLRWMFL